MDETAARFKEMRAIAAELLRAHRFDDQQAFMSAMNRAEGKVPDLLMALCFIANRGMELALSREEANALVERLARDLPPPENREQIESDAWLDAIALCETAATGDLQGSRVLLANSPDLALLFGSVMQLLATLLPTLPPEMLNAFFAAAREVQPPFT